MKLEKVAHEIAMVVLQGEFRNKGACEETARDAAYKYLTCKKAIIEKLKEKGYPEDT